MDLNTLPSLAGHGEIAVVTGGRGAGKTSYCQRAIHAWRAAGRTVDGLLCPGRFEQGEKNGFFALHLRTQESRLVASAIPGELNGIQLGPWTFDERVFAWGNRCLQQADGVDLLVVDELGPLEFNRQAGWVASFELLERKKYRLALVVIRPECIAAFSELGFTFQIQQITPPQENRS